MSRRTTKSPTLTAQPTAVEPVLIRHHQADGRWATVRPREVWSVALEDSLPARKIPKYIGQKNTPGCYYSATGQRLLTFESHLESKWMLLYDFDATVVSITAQPFHLVGLDEDEPWEHYPDLLVKRVDGSCDVVDVKNPARTNEADVLLQSRRTKSVCDAIGFGYACHGEPEPTYYANVAWLAGYRRPFPFPDKTATELLARCAEPTTIGELTDAADFPQLARAVLFQLLWRHKVVADLTAPLRDASTVWIDNEGVS